MKRLNQFTRLSKEDQTLILNLCDKLPYKEVCSTLAKPRAEGGLDLTTSPSALCKFYTRHHNEVIALESIGQFAAAIQINHQAHGEANFQALLSLVQTRLLQALRAGKSIDDLQKQFRTLERVQKCFLADEKFREQNERTQEAYLNHIKQTSEIQGDPDFIDHTLPDDPGADCMTTEDFAENLTQWDQDLEFARHLTGRELGTYPTFLRAAVRIVRQRAADKRTSNYLRLQGINPVIVPPEPRKKTADSFDAFEKKLEAELQRLEQEISPQNTRKKPVISTISTNFHSPEAKGKSA